MNETLTSAKAAKKDEFYTRYIDIQKEVEAYLEYDPDTFRGKVVYCNCDDPFESNFFKYFAANFNRLGVKKLISTSYNGSPIAGEQLTFLEYEKEVDMCQIPAALSIELEEVTDINEDGAIGIEDVQLFLERNPHSHTLLKEGGDFRSAECTKLLQEADIVVTNPPFSLFREFVALLAKYQKHFLVIGNTNSITYKEIFPLIRDDRVWLGCTNFNVGMYFEVPDNWTKFHHIEKESGKKIARVSTSCWYTNLEHGRRRQPLNLMTMSDNLRFSKKMRVKKQYDKYDNFDAIEVGTYKDIPSDYEGMMGVPITFLDKYSPDQFEIVGYEYSDELRTKVYPKQTQVNKKGSRSTVSKLNDVCAIRVDQAPSERTYYIVNDEYFIAPYKRLIIRHRNPRPEGKRPE